MSAARVFRPNIALPAPITTIFVGSIDHPFLIGMQVILQDVVMPDLSGQNTGEQVAEIGLA